MCNQMLGRYYSSLLLTFRNVGITRKKQEKQDCVREIMMEECRGLMSGVWAGSSPGHESANPGPSALCNEETNNRVGHCAPGFTDEQNHGGLEGIDLQSRAETNWSLKHTQAQNSLSFTLYLSSNTLPERCRAGRFAERRPWRWQPPPWERHRWRNTAYCIMTTCGPAPSVKTETARERGWNVMR